MTHLQLRSRLNAISTRKGAACAAIACSLGAIWGAAACSSSESCDAPCGGGAGAPTGIAGDDAGGNGGNGGGEAGVPANQGGSGGAAEAAGAGGVAASDDGGSGGQAGSGGGDTGGMGGESTTGCPGNGTECWDFESGEIPEGWEPVTDQGAGSILVDDTQPYSGTYALHVNASGNNPMHSLGFTLSENFGGVMWGRAYLYLTSRAPGQHGATIKARYADPEDTEFGPENLDWYETGLGYDTFVTIWHTPQPPSGLPEWEMISDAEVPIGEWFCQEWLFDGVNEGAEEAAEPRMWINGTELAFPEKRLYPFNAVKPPFPKAQNFILMEVGLIMYHPLEAETNLWFDDLVVGPTRIGCE